MCFKPLGTFSLCCLLPVSFCVPTVLNGNVSQLLVSADRCPSPGRTQLRLHPLLTADVILRSVRITLSSAGTFPGFCSSRRPLAMVYEA